MAKFIDDVVDLELKEKQEYFLKKIDSEMHVKADFLGELLSFEWVDVIEQACPYIDNVVRHPKLTLIREENITKIEKSKKITVASVKDLARHTNYISKVDKKTQDVQPSKILDVRNEETFNIYENRFLYTLLYHLDKFLGKKEKQLKNFEIKNNKLLEYVGSSETKEERIKIEVKITSNELPKNQNDKKIEEEIEEIKKRVKRIREYMNSWQKSEMIKALEKEHVPLIQPPIKKTNLILKNPNFQMAVKLWDYLQKFGLDEKEEQKEIIDNDGDEKLKDFLDYSFMIDFCVLDSVAKYKREQKENISKYAAVILAEGIDRVLKILLNSGIKVSEDELLGMILKEMKKEKNSRLVGVDDVKKKFKNAMDEYLERTQDYL